MFVMFFFCDKVKVDVVIWYKNKKIVYFFINKGISDIFVCWEINLIVSFVKGKIID